MDEPPGEEKVDNAQLIKKLQSSTAALVRASNQLPILGENYELYATYPEFAQFMHTQRGRILNVMRKVLDGAGLKSVRLNEARLEDMSHLVSAANDQFVERIGRELDEHQASLNQDRVKARQLELGAEAVSGASSSSSTAPIAGSGFPLSTGTRPFGKDGGGRYAILASQVHRQHQTVATNSVNTMCTFPLVAKLAQKPQQLYNFQQYIVNADLPFVHKLRIKHNALDRDTIGISTIGGDGVKTNKKLGNNLKLVSDEADKMVNALAASSSSTGIGGGGRREWLHDELTGDELLMMGDETTEHPYQLELEQFKPGEQQLAVPAEVQFPASLEDTPLVLVSQRSELEALVSELNAAPEFALDLEHHSMRSFLGITCLVQISTRSTDYVVDPFPLWDQMYLLNEPFTNPDIVKVGFGTGQDIQWLQRDFGIYVVGLFDTEPAFQAVLGEQQAHHHQKGLSSLVSSVCNVKLDKQHQRADWRIRPLPESLLTYARCDTHYLLACYDHLKIGLGSAKKIAKVYKASTNLCALQFEQPRFQAKGYQLKLLRGRSLNNRREFALEQLWRWRDETAREQDESLHYVLPDHMMLKMAETLPREQSGILACCTPVPPLVRQELTSLNGIISIARELPLEQMVQANALSTLLGQQQQQLNDSVLAATNRVTGLKAKLEFRFDNSSKRTAKQLEDEQRHQQQHGQNGENNGGNNNIGQAGQQKFDGLLHQLSGRSKSPSSSSQKEVEEGPSAQKRRRIVVVEQAGSSTEAGKERAQRIRERLEQSWASPYDKYLLALREAEEKSKADVKPDKAKLSLVSTTLKSTTMTTTTTTKKQYSHLDDDEEEEQEELVEEEREEVIRQEKVLLQGQKREPTDEGAEEEAAVDSGMDEEERAFFADPANLTKKARKRMRKKFRGAADIRLQ